MLAEASRGFVGDSWAFLMSQFHLAGSQISTDPNVTAPHGIFVKKFANVGKCAHDTWSEI